MLLILYVVSFSDIFILFYDLCVQKVYLRMLLLALYIVAVVLYMSIFCTEMSQMTLENHKRTFFYYIRFLAHTKFSFYFGLL